MSTRRYLGTGVSCAVALGLIIGIVTDLMPPVFGLEGRMRILAAAGGLLGFPVGAALGARRFRQRKFADLKVRGGILAGLVACTIISASIYWDLWSQGGISAYYWIWIQIALFFATLFLFLSLGFAGFSLTPDDDEPD